LISVDELKQRFGPSLSVAPYGECLVIQGSEFDPDWEADLGDQGFACHFGDLDGRPVTFVQLKKAVAPGKVVYVPPATAKQVQGNGEVKEVEKKVENEENKRVNWQPEEDALLISLWNQGSSIPDIAVKVEEKYPSRKGNSANMRLKRLRIVGQIQPRNKHVRGNVAKEASYQVGGEKLENSEEKKFKGCQKGPAWTPEDEQRLFKRIDEVSGTIVQRIAQIITEFPGRSAVGIKQKYEKLVAKAKQKAKENTPMVLEAKAEKSAVPHVEMKNVVFPEDLLKRIEGLKCAVNDNNVRTTIFVETCNSMRSTIVELNATVAKLRKDLIRHNHAVSGEAMLPMEASS
jgi:hypothetical protein